MRVIAIGLACRHDGRNTLIAKERRHRVGHHQSPLDAFSSTQRGEVELEQLREHLLAVL